MFFLHLQNKNLFIQNGDSIWAVTKVPRHIRRPSPRQVRHWVVAFLALLPASWLPLPASLEGSSHRFSPSRKTRLSDKSTSVAPSFTTVCLISEISVIEAIGAPFVPSWKTLKINELKFVQEISKLLRQFSVTLYAYLSCHQLTI